MSDELSEILARIEELRRKLQQLFKEKGIEDQEVFTASQILDAVLNEYYRIFRHRTEE
ncbi:MAG: aspartyl-phosphate phosphatase Spo0E family protein [Bacillota bacterium]